MAKKPTSYSNLSTKIILIVGAPLVLVMFFVIIALSVNSTILENESLREFLIAFGVGIALFILLALIFAVVVRKNIHG